MGYRIYDDTCGNYSNDIDYITLHIDLFNSDTIAFQDETSGVIIHVVIRRSQHYCFTLTNMTGIENSYR